MSTSLNDDSMEAAADDSEDYSEPEPNQISELKSKLWALSYERASNIVSCENCGSVSTVTRLLANSNQQEPPVAESFKNLTATGQLLARSCVDNRFEIVRQLGSGGMGAVYLVHDKILKKQFALKIMREDLHKAGDSTLDKRFQMEAQAALEMTHVNVVGAYCQGRHQSGAPYLVMDYIEGKSLAELLAEEKCLEAHAALNIFVQVCQALSHAHLKSLIHRDLKPANILLQECKSADPVVKLVDFGIAKTIPLFDQETLGLTNTGVLIGSPAYMSPEQCLGEELSEQSDIYSFGCVMYETLTGRPPFMGKNSIKVILDHLKTAPEPFAAKIRLVDLVQTVGCDFNYAAYRQAIEAVVLKCLEKEPKQRYKSADELRLDLECLSESKFSQTDKDKPNSKASGAQSAQRENFEGALVLVVLIAILLFVALLKLMQGSI